MSNSEIVLEKLVAMSRALGETQRDLAILGEGNTSAICDDGTFWVKASGTQLGTIDAAGFVRVNLEPVCKLADEGNLSDEELKAALKSACVDPNESRRPSVETVLHALALAETDATFVGHTHPTAVNALSCSQDVESLVKGQMFPDSIVVCGPEPAYVPYTDPGLPLARAVRKVFAEYIEKWNQTPKVLVMQNHGMIALGKSPTEVENISAMYVKTCRILAGTFAFGGPRFLSEADVERIHTRPDELYRRQQLKID